MSVRRTWLAFILLALLIFGACSKGPSTDEAPPQPPNEAPEEVAEAVPPTADELAPVLRESGEPGAVPDKLVVEFGRPIVEADQVGSEALEGTVLEVRPAIEGQLVYSSPTTLTFTPKNGFSARQTYEVELLSVGTPLGVVETPAQGRWVRVFETPTFDFVRFALQSVDFAKRRARVEMVFSAAVDPLQVSRRSRLLLYPKGTRVAKEPRIRFEQGKSPHTVVATVSGNDVIGGSRIALELQAGVPSSLDAKLVASAFEREVELAMGPAARVLASYRAEGESGFYVQVICDDSAVPSKRYYWDRVNYNSYQVSTRCLLEDADARAGLHFEPPVDFTLSSAGGGFRIFGDFERGNYRLRMDAGLRTTDGGMLHEAYETEVSIPARSPKLDFTSRGRYLPRTAWSSLPVRHRNVSSATLRVRHVPAENLVFWMSDSTEAASARTANLVAQVPLQFHGQADEETTSYVNLSDLVPAETRGLLEVQIIGGGANTTSRLLLTDLHLIAKRAAPSPETGRRQVQVWAVDVDSLEPQRGVEVSLVRPSGYAVASCRTEGDGGCRLDPSKELDPTEPFALIARQGGDLTYLKFEELRAEVQEARVAGEPYRGNQGYRAALYSDRGVYRPGETAHLAAIVRQQDHLAPPAGMPVQLALLDPQGKVVRRTPLKTNEAGVLHQDLSFPAFASTGRYAARLEVAGRTVGQYDFQVEEFVPERMRVEVEATEAEYQLGEEDLDAVAQGGSAEI